MADFWTRRSGNSSTNVTSTWTEDTRPSSPFNGQTGVNTDFDGLETYNTATSKWRILSGYWTTATRPTTTDIEPGSQGFNTDTGYGLEMWDGTSWTLL